jgi:hypothetical protein
MCPGLSVDYQDFGRSRQIHDARALRAGAELREPRSVGVVASYRLVDPDRGNG